MRRPDKATNPDNFSSAGFRVGLASALALTLGATGPAAPLPSDWQREQSFTVASSGMVKLSLPADTLDASRPGMEDLRLYTDEGAEVPYLIERPRPATKLVQGPRTFQMTLISQATILTMQSGLTQAIDGLILETPAREFIKSVKVESSTDGNRWQSLTDGSPVYRQPGGIQRLFISVPPAVYPWLRVIVDDQRSAPVPMTGARLETAAAESAPDLPVPVAIAERHENPGETRLTLQLGAAHLPLTEIELSTDEPLFSRQAQLAAQRVSGDTIVEQPLAGGVIYRVAIEGHPAVSNLTLRAEIQAPSRELLLLIRNQDSPPLPIRSVQARRRPVYLDFLAREPGIYHLLTGNRRCGAPSYDLAALGADLRSVPVTSVHVSDLTENPAYRAPEVLPGLEDHSAQLDVAEWRFRKPVLLRQNGPQQLELDPDVLSKSQAGFQDVRLMTEGRQVPYVVERTSINREIVPAVVVTNDTRDRTIGRWILKLPQAGLPLSRLTCVAHMTLFQRDMELFEEVTDDRGETERRRLGQATWVQTPGSENKLMTLFLDGAPQTDRLFLETHNGDNPTIAIGEFRLFYAVTRIVFKGRTNENLFLYFGNPEARAPHYDLSLVAAELVNADKATAELGNLEILKKPPWTAGQGRNTGVVFWVVLGLVVVALLVIIARLLPKPTDGK